MTHDEVTFYLTTVGSVIVIFSFLWKVTIGATIKQLKKDIEAVEKLALTKADLLAELMKLKDFLHKNFEQKQPRRRGKDGYEYE